MSSKALSKFWIEIIGGVIIVVIVLLVFLMFGSSVSTGVEDASNKQAFVHFTQLIGKATREGEDTVAPFNIKTSDAHRAYAILFIPPSTAECLYENGKSSTCYNSGHPQLSLDEMSKYKIEKCTTSSKENPKDICLCMIRIDSKRHKSDINLDGDFISFKGNNPKEAFDDITSWGKDVFENETLDNSDVENIKIIDCSLMMGDIGCSVRYDNDDYPCAIAVAEKENHISPETVSNWFSGDDTALLMYWFGGTGKINLKLETMTASYNGKGLVILYPYTLGNKFLYTNNDLGICIKGNGCIPFPISR